MKAIECKAVHNETGELIDWTESGDRGVTCLKEKGLLCFNNDQDEGRTCHNYKIRVFCVCAEPGDGEKKTTYVPSTASTRLPETVICPAGTTYSDCAYQCNQTCNLFLRALVRDGKCLGNDWCVPGCRPNSGCEGSSRWLDYNTCVDEEECSCAFEGDVLGANQVIDRGCERCICQDNHIVCAVQPDCRPLPTGLPQVSIPTTDALCPAVIPVVVENVTVEGGGTCIPGWSMWFNTRKPDEHGDVESVGDIVRSGLPLCDERYRTDVRCEPVWRNVIFNATDRIQCDIQRGLICRNDPTSDEEPCPDYMVRFHCDCYKNWEPTPAPATTGTTGVAGTTPLPDRCTRFVYLVNGPSPLPDSSYKASSSASPGSSPAHSRLGSTTSSTSPHRRCSRHGDIGVCETWVSVKCNSTFVKLGPTLSDVSVNGVPVAVRNLGAVSRRLGDVHLSRNGQRLVFTSMRHNFEVAFDERRTIKISVSDCLSSKTSGLCGLYDWDAKNEFRTPEDRLVSDARVFANSWASSGGASSDCALSTCPKQTRERAERWCQRIASPPLSHCLENKALLESSINSCADVVCDCLASPGGDDKKCMCSAIEGFVSKCKTSMRSQIASEWRLSLGC
ncbi:hypothetical protein V5799_025801, partial [Amblyomma americanum]